jgi:HEAT repeat protein
LEALASLSRPEALPLLRELAKDQNWRVRTVAVESLPSFSRAVDLPLLCNLAHDQHSDVRAAAVKARARWTEGLARFWKEEDLPTLRTLAQDQDPGVRNAALEALANALKGRDLSDLHNLALASNHNSAVEAVRTLASCCSREALEAFLNEHDQQLCVEALVALDELLYRPEWLKAEDRQQEK